MKILRVVFLLAGMSSLVHGQNVNATLRGTVKDASGAVIHGADIVIVNTDKGISRALKSSESGDYLALQLPAQTYSIRASARGFKTQAHDNFKLEVGQEARLDFTLSVGNVTDQVTITEVAPLIQSENASVGGVVEEKNIKELPLNGRQFWQLSQLVPGVTASPNGSTLTGRGGFTIAGSYEVSNNFILDGIDNNDRTTGQPSVRPSVDGIQEFRVLTGTYEAEYGRQSGGQILVTTKSGSNQYHGTGFEFFRNNHLDARNFFSPGDLLPFTRNQYGASGGGPIRKNKTFFFLTYEGLNSKQVNVVQGTVPTAAERSGDFSAFAKLNLTGIVNNQIPQSLWAPVSVALLKYYPASNLAAAAGGLNFVNSDPTLSSFNQFSTRVDQVLSSKNNLYGTYQFYDSYDFAPSTVPGFGTGQPQRFQHAAIVDTHIFSASLINEARVGYNRLAGLKLNQDSALGDQVKALGLPQGGAYGLEPTTALNGGIPAVSISGLGGVSGIGQSGNPQWRADNTFNVVDSLTWVRGRHTIKVGADFQDFYKHSYFETTARGSFSFNGQYTGNSFADFLLGDIYTSSRGIGDPNQHPYTKAFASYVQDEWKVLPRLTFNFGLRYEYFTPQHEVTNKLSEFDIATGTLQDGQGERLSVDPSTGLLINVGNSNIGDSLWKPRHLNFAPRFGFAYRVSNDSKTVVRGGYGVFFDQNVVGNGVFQFFGLGTPYQSAQTFTNSTALQLATWSNPFPASTNSGSYTTGGVNPNFPTAYVQQWTVGIQREIVNNLLLDVTYQGSKGTHLPFSYNLNVPTPGAGAIQARRPWPLWGGVTWVDAINKSSFNSLNVRLERRFAHGLTFNTNFLYSKSLDLGNLPSTSGSGDVNVQNRNDIAAEWGPSDTNQKFRYIGSFVYDLPFGKGRHWLTSVPRWADTFIGGWEATGILTLSTGRPFTVTTSKDISNTGGSNRAFVVAGVNPTLSNPSVAEWFNTAAFTSVVPGGGYSFGNAGRGILTAPGLQTFDAGLYKNFRPVELLTVQFRAEAFNALNSSNFSTPAGNQNSTTFGQISSTSVANRDIQFGLKLIF